MIPYGRRQLTLLSILLFASVPLFMVTASPSSGDGYSLEFDPGTYTTKTSLLNGRPVTYRAYEHVVYVKHPVDPGLENMNIYIPEEYFRGKPAGAWTATTAPIFLPNSVGGYMPGLAGTPDGGLPEGPTAALVALSKGYVVAEPGVRGRTGVDANGRYTGKAPASIVDLKAAVRYLRFNDATMPGDAGKIVSNGTGAGGALSALLGASGNDADYEPYLLALGAAEARDDIYAVSAYCPITDLEHADMAYEWLFSGINDYTAAVLRAPTQGAGTVTSGGPGARTAATGTMTEEQIRFSALLGAQFPAYLAGLGLTKDDGTILSLDADGNGSFRDYVKSFVIAAARKALAAGTDLSGLSWLTVRSGTVTDLDFDAYTRYATRMKAAPAFDGLDLATPENELFGTETVNARHFTGFGQDNDTAGGELADEALVKMMNPMSYIGVAGSTTARFWRIRHGTADRDTALAIPVILATRLSDSGYSVDFAMPWARGHAGDYDLDELFAWMDGVCRVADVPGSQARP